MRWFAACHLPENCLTTTCTKTDDFQCTECEHEGSTVETSLYWPTTDKKACEGSPFIYISSSLHTTSLCLQIYNTDILFSIATCSWEENWCWPGTCAGHLAKNCVCSNGFYKNSSSPAQCQCKSLKPTANLFLRVSKIMHWVRKIDDVYIICRAYNGIA